MPELIKRKDSIVSFFESKRNFYIVLLVSMLIKNFPFGFRYFLFADDFNQYGTYALWREDLWNNVVKHFGLFGYRPLAGLTDVYIISRLWGSFAFVLFFMVILHFLTIYLLDGIFEKSDITWGRSAAVFFGFFPAMTESAYWISSSSRIVTSAFFAVAATFAILKYIYREGKHRAWFIIAIICGLLAQGFYEQGVVFAFTLSLGALIVHRKAVKNKAIFAWPFVNLCIIGAHYYIFRDVGLLSERVPAAGAVGGFFQSIPVVLNRIITIFYKEQVPTILNSLRWGIGQLFREHLPLSILVAVFSLLLAFFILYDKPEDSGGITRFHIRKKTAYSLLAGLGLTVCTLLLFFVLSASWVWVRNFYYALIGLGIFVEIVVALVSLDNKIIGLFIRIIKTAAAAAFTFIFFCGFILEIDNLRNVEKYDNIIVTNLVAEIERMELTETETIWLFGVRWSYAPQINPRITSQVRIDWALNGHYRVFAGGRREPWIIPVMPDTAVDPDFKNSVSFGLDVDLNVRELVFDGLYLRFADTGTIFGRIETGATDIFKAP